MNHHAFAEGKAERAAMTAFCHIPFYLIVSDWSSPHLRVYRDSSIMPSYVWNVKLMPQKAAMVVFMKQMTLTTILCDKYKYWHMHYIFSATHAMHLLLEIRTISCGDIEKEQDFSSLLLNSVMINQTSTSAKVSQRKTFHFPNVP